jgi:molybdopterin-guanine dinucleotide biosynthesis protein A
MNSHCIGVILAGGLSSRMGTDKAELIRGNSSMINFCHELLDDCGVNSVRVSRNVGEGIRDIFEQSGPLGGIYSAIKTIQTGAVLIVPVDMPLLVAGDLIKLIEHGQKTQKPVCYEDCYLPLYLPVNHQVIDYLEDQLRNDGNRKVKALINQFDGIYLPVDNQTTLVNTNTPQQWQQTQLQMTSRG